MSLDGGRSSCYKHLMDSVPCPRCGKPVGLEEMICPHCRAPRDNMEMEEGRMLARKEEFRLQRRPKLIAAGAAAAVLLVAAWFSRGYVTSRLGVAWREFQLEVENTRQPGRWNQDHTVESSAAANTRPEVAISSFIYLSQNAPAPEPPPVPVTMTPLTPTPVPANTQFDLASHPGAIRVQGTVYDLSTKMPVGNVPIRFKLAGATQNARTDTLGRYQWVFLRSDADDITIMIEAPGYRKGLLEDPDPSFRERSPQSRAALIAETTDGDLEPVPLRYQRSAQIVELNLAIIPQAKK